MPNDVKASLSVLFLIVAAILAYWRGSPIRPEFSTYIMITAVFFVVAMWVFPEAGGKKGGAKKGASGGAQDWGLGAGVAAPRKTPDPSTQLTPRTFPLTHSP